MLAQMPCWTKQHKASLSVTGTACKRVPLTNTVSRAWCAWEPSTHPHPGPREQQAPAPSLNGPQRKSGCRWCVIHELEHGRQQGPQSLGHTGAQHTSSMTHVNSMPHMAGWLPGSLSDRAPSTAPATSALPAASTTDATQAAHPPEATAPPAA